MAQRTVELNENEEGEASLVAAAAQGYGQSSSINQQFITHAAKEPKELLLVWPL